MTSDVRPRTGRRWRAREDRGRIFLAKITRAVAYGALSAFLFFYLKQDLALPVFSSLVVTALSLGGAAAWNFVALPPLERRWGRRRTLLVFSGLFVASAVLLFLSGNAAVVLFAVLLGGVAASSNDNGPLASLDQAALAETLPRSERTRGYAWYNLLASFASAGGTLLVAVPGALTPRSLPGLPDAPHPWIGLIYIALAAMTLFAYTGLTDAVEVRPSAAPEAAPPRPLSADTRRYVRDLGVLFGVDAFAGGMIINPLLASYFYLAWHADPATVSGVLFVVGTVSAVSFLVASWLAQRIGLLNTMVFTHLPSNVLLAAVPFLPTFGLAFGVLVVRSAISQMDVPTRQAYVMALVPPKERAPVAGTLSGARALPQSVGPFPAVAFQAAGLLAAPFVLAGTVKVAYDLAVFRTFSSVELPPETERAERPTSSSRPPS